MVSELLFDSVTVLIAARLDEAGVLENLPERRETASKSASLCQSHAREVMNAVSWLVGTRGFPNPRDVDSASHYSALRTMS